MIRCGSPWEDMCAAGMHALGTSHRGLSVSARTHRKVPQVLYLISLWLQMRPLVEHADTLLKWSKKVLGSTIVNAIVRHTFFHQFCAGKSHQLKPKQSVH